MSTWRFEKECTDCHRREYLPTNYLRNIWRNTDTLNNPTHQDYGNMLLSLYGSTSMWMTLALNMLDESTYNICMTRYRRKHMKLSKIWMATSTVALP